MKDFSLALINIGMMAGWIFLAVHFDKWWIALFAILTIFSSKTERLNK